EGSGAHGDGPGGGTEDPAAPADTAVSAGAALATRGPVVGERAVGDREGGEVRGDAAALVSDAAAVAEAAPLAGAPCPADRLVGGDGAWAPEGAGPPAIPEAAAGPIAAYHVRVAGAADGPIVAERTVADDQGRAHVAGNAAAYTPGSGRTQPAAAHDH